MVNSQVTFPGTETQIVSERASPFFDVAAFLVPFFLFVEFKIIGRLFLAEILAVIALFVFMTSRRLEWTVPPIRNYLLLCCLALLSQAFTDYVRDTAFDDWTRGSARLIFLMSNFACFALLFIDRPKRIQYAAIGMALGLIVQFFVAPNIYAGGHPWKFGVGFSVTTLLVTLANSLLRGRNIGSALFIIAFVAFLNLVLGFRSLAVVCGFLGAYVFLMCTARAEQNLHVVSIRRLIFPTLLACFVAYLLLEIYVYSVQEGWMGDDDLEKYLAQSAGAWGVLVGGRLDVLGGLMAISDSPFIGYGSWAKDPDYIRYLFDEFTRLGYGDAASLRNFIELEGIPAHSYLIGAWVEGGILAAPLWLWALFLIAKALIGNFRINWQLATLSAYLLILEIWNILFSPLGAEHRLISGICMGAAVASWFHFRQVAGRPVSFHWR